MDAFQQYFVDVIKNHYADFEGRARRKEYWMFQLFSILIILAIAIVAAVLGSIVDILGTLGFIVYFAFALGILIPSLAVAIRRLHDTGRSGWWYLVSLIPFGAFVLLYFMVIEGDAGPNEYGPDPKDPYPEGAGIDEFSGVLER